MPDVARTSMTTRRVHRARLGCALAAALALAVPAQAPAQSGGQDTAELLQQLIRFDTSNPPAGNTQAIAAFLQARLQPLGFETEVIPTPKPGTVHLVARLRAPAGATEKPLLLAAHTDVVPAERDRWSLDPFAGVLRDGWIYGRGAIDFKAGLAIFTQAVSRLAARRATLDRDVILLAEADEEDGDFGTEWLAENHWAKIDAGAALNEGGWVISERGKPRVVGVTTQDKVFSGFRLIARGTSTHSSRPYPDNAIFRLGRALAKLSNYKLPVTLTPLSRRYFRAWAQAAPDAASARALRTLSASRVDRDRERAARSLVRDSEQGILFGALVRTTLAPTLADAGIKNNVIPASAEAYVNMRVVPGTNVRAALDRIRRVVRTPGVRLRVGTGDEREPAAIRELAKTVREQPESSPDTGLYRAYAAEARRAWPTAEVTPALFEAGTDATPWRERGIPVYGIYPYPIDADTLLRMHGNDERVQAAAVEDGTEVVYRTLVRATGGG